MLQQHAQENRFFRAMLSNMEQVMAKTDLTGGRLRAPHREHG
ncbi:MAG: hypothetical protein ACFNX4_10405 [Actinomyces oris]